MKPQAVIRYNYVTKLGCVNLNLRPRIVPKGSGCKSQRPDHGTFIVSAGFRSALPPSQPAATGVRWIVHSRHPLANGYAALFRSSSSS